MGARNPQSVARRAREFATKEGGNRKRAKKVEAAAQRAVEAATDASAEAAKAAA